MIYFYEYAKEVDYPKEIEYVKEVVKDVKVVRKELTKRVITL